MDPIRIFAQIRPHVVRAFRLGLRRGAEPPPQPDRNSDRRNPAQDDSGECGELVAGAGKQNEDT